jgi:hypothetical protein
LADPDPIPFQPNIKLNLTFSRNSQYAVQNIGNYDTSDADEKDKTMLKGPKLEIFGSRVFPQIRPICVGDLGTRRKKSKC